MRVNRVVKNVFIPVFLIATLSLVAQLLCVQENRFASDQDAFAAAMAPRDGISCDGDDGNTLPATLEVSSAATPPRLLQPSTSMERRPHARVCIVSHAPRAPPVFA